MAVWILYCIIHELSCCLTYRLPSTCTTLCFKQIRFCLKIMVLSCGTLSQCLDLNGRGTFTISKHLTVIGLSLTALGDGGHSQVLSTVDWRPSPVDHTQLCVQHGEQLEHHAAPSVSAETCYVVDARIASIQQKLGLYKEAVDLYNSVLQQSPDYVPALQGVILSICQH